MSAIVIGRIGPWTARRRELAVELADTLVEMLCEPSAAGYPPCPLCQGEDGSHDADWGDGKGCPVLEYMNARRAEIGQ